ncbi:MAG: hypothetical protein HY914_05715 [Desulfomonile tiedjei]|nr:hypothetical protein [Desulfomonile tiedjei]
MTVLKVIAAIVIVVFVVFPVIAALAGLIGGEWLKRRARKREESESDTS